MDYGLDNSNVSILTFLISITVIIKDNALLYVGIDKNVVRDRDKTKWDKM